MIALTLLLRFWRESLIAVLIVGLIASCVSRDHRIAARAVAQEHSRQADSVLGVVTPRLAKVETLFVRDTVKVRVAINHVTVLRDTLLLHLTDTVMVKEYVARTDSVVQACTELSNDCATFRSLATQKIAALETKLAAQPAMHQPSKAETVKHWTTEALKACAFISMGRSKPCWAR